MPVLEKMLLEMPNPNPAVYKSSVPLTQNNAAGNHMQHQQQQQKPQSPFRPQQQDHAHYQQKQCQQPHQPFQQHSALGACFFENK
jgi:hypothetical protein